MKYKINVIKETEEGFEIEIPQPIVKKHNIQDGDKGKFEIDVENKIIKFLGVVKNE